MSTNTTDTKTEKKGPPKIVRLNTALALAEKWVSNMTQLPVENESFETTESRPARLGLGAKVPRSSTFVLSDDPLEKKLHYKLMNDRKRKAAETAESTPTAKDDDGDDDDDEDSKTRVFQKKRPANPVIPSSGKKKRRK